MTALLNPDKRTGLLDPFVLGPRSTRPSPPFSFLRIPTDGQTSFGGLSLAKRSDLLSLLPASAHRQNSPSPPSRRLHGPPNPRCRTKGRPRKAHHVPHSSPFVCHTLARMRYRHPHRPKPSRPCRRLHHHDDLPPCHETSRRRGSQPLGQPLIRHNSRFPACLASMLALLKRT